MNCTKGLITYENITIIIRHAQVILIVFIFLENAIETFDASTKTNFHGKHNFVEDLSKIFPTYRNLHYLGESKHLIILQFAEACKECI